MQCLHILLTPESVQNGVGFFSTLRLFHGTVSFLPSGISLHQCLLSRNPHRLLSSLPTSFPFPLQQPCSTLPQLLYNNCCSVASGDSSVPSEALLVGCCHFSGVLPFDVSNLAKTRRQNKSLFAVGCVRKQDTSPPPPAPCVLYWLEFASACFCLPVSVSLLLCFSVSLSQSSVLIPSV